VCSAALGAKLGGAHRQTDRQTDREIQICMLLRAVDKARRDV